MEVKIPIQVYQKIMHWINTNGHEVGGFGKVVWDAERKTFRVVDAYLLKQEVGAAHTDIDADSMCDLMVDTFKVEGELKWWWHSHVNMDVFWSTTDRDTIKEIGEQGWCLATVFNKKYQMRSALGFTNDLFTAYSFMDELLTTIDNPSVTAEMKEEWDKEYKEKVREKTYTPYVAPMYNHKGIRDNWTAHDGYLGNGDDDSFYKAPYIATDEGQLVRADQAFNDRGNYLEEEYKYGLLGFGLKAEAAALGMTPKGLAGILDQELQDPARYKKTESKLIYLEGKGKFTQDYVDRFETQEGTL